MPVLPFVLAALSVIWFSAVGAEPVSVVLWACIAPTLAALVLPVNHVWNKIGFHKCRSARSRWLNGLVFLVCLTVFVSVPRTHWPLRIAYKFSQPAFEDAARSLRAGAKFEQPVQVGLFFIEKAEIYELNGKVCLWTSLDSSGKTGFTQCPPKNLPFNLWSTIELDESWQLVSED